jgi:hypothetical protein
MASDTFSPQGHLLPDWSAAENWSGTAVPGAGTTAIVNAIDAYIDPQTTLSASIILEGGAALIGDGGGYSFTPGSSLQADDFNALDANGAIVNQGVIAVAGADATLSIVVQAGSGIAQLYGLAEPSFENAGSVAVTGGATLEIDGTELSNTGTVFLDDGALLVDGGWVDGGQGALVPGGEIELSKGGYASFSDGVIDQSFVFNGPGTIALGDPADTKDDAIAGFGYRDEILVGSMAQAKSLIAGGLTFTTPFLEGYTLAAQAVNGGAEIFLAYDESAPPCFARGTRILTQSGYVPVEQLQPGDSVATIGGGLRAVRWVGWRTVDLQTHTRRAAVWPVCITANALADGRPARDVFLSPDHAVFLHGQLVPVKLLVNSATIRRDKNCLAVTYFHIELDRHDVVIAENIGLETYLDTGNRHMFENATGKPWATPVFGRGKQFDSRAYAELCLSGSRLRAIRDEIFQRTLALGYRQKTMQDISLIVDGRTISRGFGVPSLPCFRLEPGHSGIVTIHSSAFVPAELSGGAAFEDDWRSLGVAIRRIKLGLKSVRVRDIARSGFHPRGEHDVADWTNGDGEISVASDTTVIGLNISALPKMWQAPLGAPSRE